MARLQLPFTAMRQWSIFKPMHEMSVAMSLVEMARAEAERQHCARLTLVRVEYGALAGIMPEALQLCFESLVKGTADENARLELVVLPLRLRCPFCGERFGGEDRQALWAPCPKCGEAFGHIVEQGRELLLSRIEAMPE